jgi:hypothetical protein
MKRRTLHLGAAGLATVAAAASLGCAGLGGPPTVTLSERELAALLTQSLPVDRRLAEVFDVTLSRPRLRLLPERNRLAAEIAVQARERVLGVAWRGTLDFDAALRWEPRDHSVRLAQVRVNDLRSDGAMPDAATRGAERLAGAIVERVIEDLSLYALPAERAEPLRRNGLAPGAVTVTPRGVEITFAPRAP